MNNSEIVLLIKSVVLSLRNLLIAVIPREGGESKSVIICVFRYINSHRKKSTLFFQF
jgi:hypothetical protein